MGDIPISLKVQNYKCFGEVPEGFEVIKTINVIIGRNNSGKSALIDLVQEACKEGPQFRPQDSPSGRQGAIVLGAAIVENMARAVFPENTSGGPIDGSHWKVGRNYVGKGVVWAQPNGSNRSGCKMISISEDLSRLFRDQKARTQLESRFVELMTNPLEGKRFRRIAAERDVQPEAEGGELEPQPGGLRVTNIIQSYSNLAKLDRDMVDVTLLKQLNEVTEPDYSFSAIVPRKLENGQWEISLREQNKGLVPLSASGSGLKTILCVLVNLILWPKQDHARSLSAYVFAFEELENSLHPALLRRLLQYVSGRIKAESSYLFLTTHSSVVIDMFANDPDAQIIHTTHPPGEVAKARTVSEYSHRRGVLDDLDIRASDLLQSNGIVWVEGPSDRTYITHWIALATDGALREGTHYQCVFYGGKLLSHLSAEQPEDQGALLSILRVNRNAAVVIDSDKRDPNGTVNETKRRIAQEIERMEGFSWITKGREIENYLPTAVVAQCEGLERAPDLDPFADMAEYLEALKPGSGKRFERGKTEFAARAIEFVALPSQSPILDWREKIDELCAHIRRWNRLPQKQ